jgi:hypothetical protein
MQQQQDLKEHQDPMDVHVITFKKVLNEYQMLVVKMVEDNVSIVIVKTNYELFYDVETLLGLACVLVGVGARIIQICIKV